MSLSKAERITAEIVRNYLETVSEEMSKIVENTAMSQIFSEAHDYSTGIFYRDSHGVSIVARAKAVPVHIFAALTSVETMLDTYGDDVNQGDTFFVSDPYFGGSHIPDWTIVQPVFCDGEPRFFTSVRGHLNDVGGCAPGGYNTEAREIWHEGFRCPPVKLFDAGEPVTDILELIVANTRQAEAIYGDINAMMGACKMGAGRVEEVVAKYGLTLIERCVDYSLDYSEARLRAEIADWPDGTYHGTSILDHDFAGGGEIPVHAAVTVSGDRLIIDLTGSHDQVPGFVNSVAANTISNVYSSLVALCPDIPVNSGYFRPTKIVLPSHSVVNADAPAPVGHSTVCIGSDIMEAVMKAFEHVVPARVGSVGIDLCNFRVFGTNSRNGKYFLSGDLNVTAMSTGGTKGVDGWGGWSAPFCALKLPPLEMYEWEFPFRYSQMEYETDSAAPGMWRGAPATLYRRIMLDDVLCIAYTQGYRHPLQGYCGGKAGAGNIFVVNEGRPDEVVVETACFNVPMAAGAVLFARSGGGGGWGNPFDRDPERVLEDVLEDYVSVESAARDYGVVIDLDGERVDLVATEELRRKRREVA
jgi:N-methylhydantoinase B